MTRSPLPLKYSLICASVVVSFKPSKIISLIKKLYDNSGTLHMYREPVPISSPLVGWLGGVGLKITELMTALLKRNRFYNCLSVKIMSSQN